MEPNDLNWTRDYNSEIIVYDPTKYSEELYYSKIMSSKSDGEFTFQFKTKFSFKKEDNKCKLNIDEEHISKMSDISNFVIENTANNSESWFGKKIEFEKCKDIYKDALVGNTLHCFYDTDTLFYKNKGEVIDISEMKKMSDIHGICLLKCNYVIYTKTLFFIRWEISQFKLKNINRDTNLYIMRENPEDTFQEELPKNFLNIEQLQLF